MSRPDSQQTSSDTSSPRTALLGGAVVVIVALAAFIAWKIIGGGQSPAPAKNSASAIRVTGGTSIENGRYLIMTGGCNDCHTPGFMERGMQVPESEWLTGVPLGWRGPWGTSYGSNLRRFFQPLDEESFVKLIGGYRGRPPMTWDALKSMSDDDLKSICAYIKSLPVTGEKMPEPVPPGIEPKTPYLSMEPVMPKAQTRPAGQ